MVEEREKKVKLEVVKLFYINDHRDLLVEILKRLDGHSLGVAACVCRLWRSLTCNDWLWETICFRHVSPSPYDVRPVVMALGGYRRLYMVCLRPLLTRLCSTRDSERFRSNSNRVWTRDELQLSLSLFSIDYYERLGSSSSTSTSSLMFLCKAVNV
ncbi:F-box protein SNE-like [Macadamia integrifolia]|uniref:F-box protein SNE-like n=1 Tax=Macadamia integrifolia TaxID=60698 RepID=UPI001C4F38D1|nr:F-box protein SNE-like [Macadamia integrifolia]